MKSRTPLLVFTVSSLLAGCANLNSDTLMQSGMQAWQAVTLSDKQVQELSSKSCQQLDSNAKIAPANSAYSKRLKKIANALGDNINGTPANYKVYLTKELNAWATANGCIRVYSGLMDKMNDNEIEGIVGHEMGHVALGHSRKAMQVAMSTTAARGALASVGGAVASLSQSQLGELSQKLINARFSQAQESQADDYSFDLLKKRGINPLGLATSFEKLAKLDNSESSSLFDSHPASAARAEHIRARIAAEK